MYKLKKFKKIKSLVHGISTKSDGNMSFNWGTKTKVVKNRKKFFKELKIPLQKCVSMRLEHKNKIIKINLKHAGKGILTTNAPKCDALITFEKNLFLFLLTADCLPIIFFDPQKQLLALAHISWKNTTTLFSKDIIKKFKKLGSNPKNIIVGVGPCIHKESYIKEKDIPNWGKFIKKINKKSFQLDLVGYNLKQLLDFGILKKNIEISPIDTVKSKEFFSHYRAKKTKKPEARFATIAGMI